MRSVVRDYSSDFGCSDVPALGVEEGDEGVIRGLQLDNETVLAFVAIAYSTGQPRGEVTVEIKPSRKVRSYTTTSL